MSTLRDRLATPVDTLAAQPWDDGLSPSFGDGKTSQHPQFAPSGGAGGEHPLFTGAGDTVGDSIGTATALGIDTSVAGAIDAAGDQDFYSINLVAGTTYTFSLERDAWTSGIDPFLELRDNTGALITSDDDGGIFQNSQITFTATSTGTYYLNAHSFDDGAGGFILTTNTLETGNTSPTSFPANGKPIYSWEQAGFQIDRDFQSVSSTNWPGDQASWASHYNIPGIDSGPTIITYAFRSSAPAAGMPEDTAGFSEFSAAQIAAATAALAAWAAVANIQFVRVDDGGGYSNNANILFGNYSSGASAAAAFAYLPVSGGQLDPSEGGVWVNNTLSYNANPVVGDYGQQVLLHEIGHALGLSHPGDYNAAPGVNPTYQNNAAFYQDSRMFTVMSYFGSSDAGGNLGLYASLPQLYDIAAIQHLYGANESTRTDNTTYGFNSNTGLQQYSLTSASDAAVFSIWDAGGNDTLDLSGYSTASIIDLREEAMSSAGQANGSAAHWNISIARGAVIENAIGGAGADTIIGNAVANTITGGAGADTITGGLGNDTLFGNDGVDTFKYTIGDGADTIDGGNGTDILSITGLSGDDALVVAWNGSALSVAGGSLTSVENIVADLLMGTNTLAYSGATGVTVNLGLGSATGFLGISNVQNVTGGGGNDALTGDANANLLDGALGNDTLGGGNGNDTLFGRAGNDWLDGNAGADTMFGGDGDDTYWVDNAGDVVIDNGPTGGVDEIISVVSRTMNAGIENLLLTGALAIDGTGNNLDNDIQGNNAANTLFGKLGNDVIGAGAGNDSLYGGDGNDSLNGNDDADFLDGGNDTDFLSGGAGADTLYGRAGNDILQGDAGADTMFGGDGDDTYYVDNAGDIVGESAGAGTDSVLSTVSYSLGQYVENLTLLGTATTGVGNILNNVIAGTSVANTLSGFAGADTLLGNGGDDTLNGGDGADALYGYDNNDLLDGGNDNDILWGGDGTDTLYGRTGNDTLNGEAGADTLYGGDGDDTMSGGDDNDFMDGGNHNDSMSGGAGNDTLYGRQNDDTLNGNDGNDTLFGGDGNDTLNGGTGTDVISGGNGDDTFVFTPGGGTNATTVTDFVAGGTDDTLDLSAYNGTGVTWIVSQVGADTHFAFSNGDALTLSNVNMNNLVVIDPWHYG